MSGICRVHGSLATKFFVVRVPIQLCLDLPSNAVVDIDGMYDDTIVFEVCDAKPASAERGPLCLERAREKPGSAERGPPC